MKNKILGSALGLTAINALFLGAHAGASDRGGYREAREGHEIARRHRDRGDGFREIALGICAGQALAHQGVSIPLPQPGQALDASTREQVEDALDSCRSQMEGGTGASPSPSESPAPSATPSPSTAPAPGGSPSPSASSGSLL